MNPGHQLEWKTPVLDGRCPTAIEWAQMASFLDGEGSILINTQKRRGLTTAGWYLRITVANTDIRLMAWLKERFGGVYRDANTEKYYEGKNWKRAYHWSLGGYPAAWVLRNCLPYFVMKGEQAEIGISLQESIGPYSQGRARKLSEETMTHRRELKRRLLVLKAKGRVMEPAQAQRIAEVS